MLTLLLESNRTKELRVIGFSFSVDASTDLQVHKDVRNGVLQITSSVVTRHFIASME